MAPERRFLCFIRELENDIEGIIVLQWSLRRDLTHQPWIVISSVFLEIVIFTNINSLMRLMLYFVNDRCRILSDVCLTLLHHLIPCLFFILCPSLGVFLLLQYVLLHLSWPVLKCIGPLLKGLLLLTPYHSCVLFVMLKCLLYGSHITIVNYRSLGVGLFFMNRSHHLSSLLTNLRLPLISF